VLFESGQLKYLLYRLVEEIALRASDGIIVATVAQQQELAARYGSDKITWIPNSVDTDMFRPDIAPRSDYLLYVGRLTAQKNLRTLLRSLAEADADRPVMLVGQGEEEAPLRELACKLGVAARFAGVIPHDHLPPVYASAWAFVLPSLFEGMPKALLEAMSCGLACLGSDVVGIRELVADGETGLLAPPTVDGLAMGLCRLADSSLRASLGEKARRHVVDSFSSAQVLEREIALLQAAQS